MLVGVTIFAAANAITRRLTDLGATNLIDGRNPISFCNVLFAGNLVALVAIVLVYRQQLAPKVWRRLSGRSWLMVVLIAVLAGALAPAMLFSALDHTTVNNVILISRIEPPLTLALSVVFLRASVNRWVVFGSALAFIGVVLTIWLQTPDSATMNPGQFQIGKGELMAIVGAMAAAIATVLSQASLSNFPIGLFNILRTAIGTVVFFTVTAIWLGLEHFQDLFAPIVWQWMIIYSLVIVVGGQLAWFSGLQHSRAAEVSLASSLNPIIGILAAFLILQELPTAAQYIGGAVILAGIGLNQLGVSQQAQTESASLSDELASEVGFRGI